MNHYTNILSYCTDAYATELEQLGFLIFTILHKIVDITALVIAYAIYRYYYILQFIYSYYIWKNSW